MMRFIVYGVDVDNAQWCSDFVAAKDKDEAVEAVAKARPYVLDLEAWSVEDLQDQLNYLRKCDEEVLLNNMAEMGNH